MSHRHELREWIREAGITMSALAPGALEDRTAPPPQRGLQTDQVLLAGPRATVFVFLQE